MKSPFGFIVKCKVVRAAELIGDKLVSVLDTGVELVAVQGIRNQEVIKGGIRTKVLSVTQLIKNTHLMLVGLCYVRLGQRLGKARLGKIR